MMMPILYQEKNQTTFASQENEKEMFYKSSSNRTIETPNTDHCWFTLNLITPSIIIIHIRFFFWSGCLIAH